MIVQLTQAAEEQVEKLANENEVYGVSLNIKGGGCAGFEYDWQLVSSPTDLAENDEVYKTKNGASFVIGVHSIMFLMGSIIDYKKDIMGAMFDIQNPNAHSSCGCGVSVNFDDSVFA
jgi:iron-sulfur cluster assembly protein